MAETLRHQSGKLAPQVCQSTNTPASGVLFGVIYRIHYRRTDCGFEPVQVLRSGARTRTWPTNGNVRGLPPPVTAGPVLDALCGPRAGPGPPRRARAPNVAELLRKAGRWRDLLESGDVTSRAELARQEGLTRARVTQILNLLRLAPDVQAAVRSLPRESMLSERALRPMIQHPDDDTPSQT